MSLAGLTTGQSLTVKFTDSTGLLRFAKAESFTYKQDPKIEKEILIDGTVLLPLFQQGLSGSAIIPRQDNSLDVYFSEQEANYYAGNDQRDVTITMSIKESDGTISQYIFLGCVLTLEDGGMYAGDQITKQHISFMASKRQLIS